jgi:hypothetical protein
MVNKQSKGERQSEGESNNVKQDEKKEKKNLQGDDDSPDVPKAAIKRSRKQSI